MIIFLLVVVSVLLLAVNWIYLLKECNRINIPGPMPLPVLGNAHLFLVKPTEFLNLLQTFINKYGDAIRVHFLSAPYVLLNHPKYIEPLMSSMDFITKGQSYNFLKCWLGQGLVTSTGQRWQNHRKILTPAFHFDILQNFLPVFCKNQRVFTKKLRKMADGSSINMLPLVTLAALDNVTESLMGVCVDAQKCSESEYVNDTPKAAIISVIKSTGNKVQGEIVTARKPGTKEPLNTFFVNIEPHEDNKLVRGVRYRCITKRLSGILATRAQIPLLRADAIFSLLPYKTRQDKALKILHEQTNKVIRARRDELKKANSNSLALTNDIGKRNKHAFLDLLLLSESDGKMDAKSVQEQVDTFMFGGHDTVSTGIVFTLHCLSKHRDVQEKIYEELKTIFGDDMGRHPTYNELHRMKYLELVIKESMRLFPPVPLIERLVEKDCDIGDLKVIKGTSLVIDIYHMQRHPELYEDPLEFRPERFETPLKNPFNWLAFSAGPRNCIGQKYAMMELKVILSELVKNFVVLPSDIESVLSANIVLKSETGVHVKLLQRV